jgi:hypothetical protein
MKCEDILGMDGELYLTVDMLYEEIAEARSNCESESIFRDVLRNLFIYYNVAWNVEDFEF